MVGHCAISVFFFFFSCPLSNPFPNILHSSKKRGRTQILSTVNPLTARRKEYLPSTILRLDHLGLFPTTQIKSPPSLGAYRATPPNEPVRTRHEEFRIEHRPKRRSLTPFIPCLSSVRFDQPKQRGKGFSSIATRFFTFLLRLLSLFPTISDKVTLSYRSDLIANLALLSKKLGPVSTHTPPPGGQLPDCHRNLSFARALHLPPLSGSPPVKNPASRLSIFQLHTFHKELGRSSCLRCLPRMFEHLSLDGAPLLMEAPVCGSIRVLGFDALTM